MCISCEIYYKYTEIYYTAILLSWIIPKYQFWRLKALAYLLMIIVYLIFIDLRKETGADQYVIMLIENVYVNYMIKIKSDKTLV